MYQIDDRISAIKEVQRLLRLNRTGIYDANTKNSVGAIQDAYSLEKTNIVDYNTFNAILTEYRKRADVHTNYLYLPKYPYVTGDLDENVRLIHTALFPVLADYRYEGDIPSGNYLNKNTIDAVNFLRAIFKMPTSDNIDEEFVNRLILEKNNLEIKNKFR